MDGWKENQLNHQAVVEFYRRAMATPVTAVYSVPSHPQALGFNGVIQTQTTKEMF